MAVKFSPIFNSQVFDENGDPGVGWKVNSYLAGSSTPATTFTTSAGDVAQTNPIVLNALGFPTTGQVWLTEGVSYKLVLTNAADVVKKTEDNISGVNDPGTLSVNEWVAGPAPTFISATSFSLVGDQTTIFHVGRRLKTTNSGGTIYSRITVSAFTTLTTVTVVNDSGVLDSGLSAVSYGLVSYANTSAPMSEGVQGGDIASSATINLTTATGDVIDVTGTTTITAITLSQGRERTVRFTGALTLTHGASLILPGSLNILTAAGDYAIFRGYASGIVRCVLYSPLAATPAGPRPVRVLHVNTTAVGNVGAGEDILMAFSLPANSLDVTGKGVRVTDWGTSANNANAKTLTVYFGTAAFALSLTASMTKHWKVDMLVFRTGANAQDYLISVLEGGTVGSATLVTPLTTEVRASTTQTDTAAIAIQCTGTATDNNDIVQEGMFVEYLT